MTWLIFRRRIRFWARTLRRVRRVIAEWPEEDWTAMREELLVLRDEVDRLLNWQEFVTVPEAARILDRSRQTIGWWLKPARRPAWVVPVGRLWRAPLWRLVDLRRLDAERRRVGARMRSQKRLVVVMANLARNQARNQ